MTAYPIDLARAFPSPERIPVVRIASRLGISRKVAAQLKALAIQTPPLAIVHLMRQCGINRVEAEAFILLRSAPVSDDAVSSSYPRSPV